MKVFSNSWEAAILLDERNNLPEEAINDGSVRSFITDSHNETAGLFEEYKMANLRATAHARSLKETIFNAEKAFAAGLLMGVADTGVTLGLGISKMPSMISDEFSNAIDNHGWTPVAAVAGTWNTLEVFATGTASFLVESAVSIIDGASAFMDGRLAEAGRGIGKGVTGLKVAIDGAKGLVKTGVTAVKIPVNLAEAIAEKLGQGGGFGGTPALALADGGVFAIAGDSVGISVLTGNGPFPLQILMAVGSPNDIDTPTLAKRARWDPDAVRDLR